MLSKFDKSTDKIGYYTQRLRSRLLRPLLYFLTKIKFTANTLSTLKILSGIIGLASVRQNIFVSFYLYLLAFCFDLLDGSLARYQQRDSDRGKFVDIITDQILYCLIIFSLIWADFSNTYLLAYSLFALPILYSLVIVNKNEKKPTDWIICPIARISYYKITIFIFASMALLEWVDKEFFEIVLFILNIFISLHIVYSYFSILNKKNV